MEADKKEKAEKEKPPHIVVRNTADYQRMKLEKLMRNPDKPVLIPERPKERGSPHVPDFVRNVMGSSAGAGSGEFHVYRHLRRKEYARQKYMQEKAIKEKQDEDYKQRLEENKKLAEERTAKKRAKRLKKNKKLKKKKAKVKLNKESSSGKSEESSSDEESDDDDEHETSEGVADKQNCTLKDVEKDNRKENEANELSDSDINKDTAVEVLDEGNKVTDANVDKDCETEKKESISVEGCYDHEDKDSEIVGKDSTKSVTNANDCNNSEK